MTDADGSTVGTLQEATAKLSDAHEAAESGDEEVALMAVEQCMEDLRNFIREQDAGEDNAPMWELTRDDVEDYVGCRLTDVAFSGFGTAAILVFEREDGSLHGFKLTPRENIRVCNVEVS